MKLTAFSRRFKKNFSRTIKLFSENDIPQNSLQINNFRPDRNLTQITNGNNLIRSVDTGHPYMLRIRNR